MKSSHENEFLKRRFFFYLEEVKRFAPETICLYEHALLLWQEFTDNKDFGSFGVRQVRSFKAWIRDRKTKKGQPLSVTYIYHTFRMLKGFFEWLAMQQKYKSKIDGTVIQHLSLPRKETNIALQANRHKIPSLEEVIRVIESIKIQNDIDKRDRALISFVLLTAGRISAVTSLPIMAFDEKDLIVYQNPKNKVKTKFAKNIDTVFFNIEGTKAVDYVLDWHAYLKNKKGFKPTDPLFPMAKLENGKQNISYHSASEVMPIFWKNANAARIIFKKRFIDAGIPYYNPHSLRHLIVKEISKTVSTEEQKKAVSQNIGHSHVGTTFGSYGGGKMDEDRMIEIVRKIKIGGKGSGRKPHYSDEELNDALLFMEAIKKKRENI